MNYGGSPLSRKDSAGPISASTPSSTDCSP